MDACIWVSSSTSRLQDSVILFLEDSNNNVLAAVVHKLVALLVRVLAHAQA